MVKIGNWLFKVRNYLFPVFYLLLFIPSPKIFNNYLTALIAGIIVSLTGEFVRALVMGLVNIQHGGRERTIYSSSLITKGIFSHCRNPLYIGNILILTGLGIAANSLLFLLFLIPMFIFFYQAIVLAEEDYLTASFGKEYLDYKAKVNRWWPDLTGIATTFQSMHFSRQRVLVKEYNSTYLWMSGFVLLAFKQVWFTSHAVATNMLPYFIEALIFLLICYLYIRYMKKSGRWTAG